ncbi:MAG: cytochrome P450 [Acidimicrobiales bacterium]|nr:cytochrome P450 [Acidimicrobiales bacterium]
MNAIAEADYEERLARFDLFDPDLQEADLWPFFDWIRENRPIARTSALEGVWIVSRYEDVLHVYQHPEIFSNRAVVWPFEEASQLPLNLDPPQHNAFRHLLAPMFSPASARRMDQLLREVARELIGTVREKGGCEAVTEFARPLPAKAFLSSFAVDPDLLPEMQRCAESSFVLPEDEEGWRELHAATESINGYFRDIVTARRREGATGEDVPSQLVRATVEGRSLTDDEIVNMLNLLMAASLDTTTSTLANILTWLAENPDRRDELVADPSLLPDAIEEFLRYEPMLFNGRMVVQETELRGVTMRPGDRVMMLFSAAMRDPRVFDRPDEVLFDRETNRHLTFGAGPHRCLGSHLARYTLRVALEEWHRAFPSYQVRPGTRPRRRLTMVMAVKGVDLVVDPAP